MNIKFWYKFFIGQFTLYGGGSGGGQPQSSTVTNTNIPEYARPYVETMLGATQQQLFNTKQNPGTINAEGVTTPGTTEITGIKPYTPYSANVNDYFAGFSPMQQQAQQGTANLQVPGQIGTASNITGQAAMGSFGAAGQAGGLQNQALGFGAGGAEYGALGAQYGNRGAIAAEQGFNAGDRFAQQATNPGATQAYMSPYMQNVVDYQKSEATRDFQKQGAGRNAQAVAAGAFGGSRQAIVDAEAQRNLNTQLQGIQATGTQKAFEDAQRQQQFGANLGIQGLQAGYQGVAQGIQGAQSGMQGAQTGLQGVQGAIGAGQYGLQGLGQAGQLGGQLAGIGGQQLAAQQGILSAQNQMGGQQQQLEQSKINQAIQDYAVAQQYPQQQLSFMNSMLRGLPLQSGTTQMYQAAPSALSQIGGLGLAGAGAYNLATRKEGGVIKSYAGGGSIEDDGIASFSNGGINRRVFLSPEDYSEQTINRSTKNGVINDIVGLTALKQKNEAAKAKQAQMAMAQGAPPTIKDQLLAEAQQLQGINNAQSNLPMQYAGGGIVAFNGEDGSQVQDRSAFSEDIDGILKRIKAGEFNPFNAIKKFDAPVRGYFTAPRQPSSDADAQPGGYYASGSNVAPAPAAKPADIMKVERKPAATTTTLAPAQPQDNKDLFGPPADLAFGTPAAAPVKQDLGDGGIEDLIKQSIGDLRTNQQTSKDARKDAKFMAMIQAGLGIMGGTSPFAAANFKGAMPGLQAYQEEMRNIREDEGKQITQIAALNLKGAELKNELKKFGITEDYYKASIELEKQQQAAQGPLIAAKTLQELAQAGRLNSGEARKGVGKAGLGGAIPPNVFDTINQRYEGYRANPLTSPVFNFLPEKVQLGFKQGYKPGDKSYANLMQEYNKAAEIHMQNYLDRMSVSNRNFAVQ